MFSIYFILCPFFLRGIAYVIIFVTMLEFICAQAPNSMKGILIGVWYSMLFIKYSIIGAIDVHFYYLDLNIMEYLSWYQRISYIPFNYCFRLLACTKYQYRQRNEVVSEQRMIEDLYERELLLNNSSLEDDDSDS